MNDLLSFGSVAASFDSQLVSPRHQFSTVSTASHQFAQAKPAVMSTSGHHDLVLRVVGASSNSFDIAAWRTVDFQAALQSIITSKDAAIDRLKAITNWQKHRLDYQAVYNAYLLGSIEEDEFIEESDKFSTDYKLIEPVLIAADIQTYSTLLDFTLSPADYADFFGVELTAVMTAVSLLPVEAKHILSTSETGAKLAFETHTRE